MIIWDIVINTPSGQVPDKVVILMISKSVY